MSENKMQGNDFVKKEIAYIIALVALVAGFLGGVVFSAYKGGTQTRIVQTGTQQSMPPQASQGMTPDVARQILALEKEVSQNPQNVTAWANLGHVYFDTNKYKKAINAYEQALQLNPNAPDLWVDLGVMYRRDKQPDKALEAFAKAISLQPSHEQARFNTGIVLMYDKNDKEGAIRAWEKLVEINPAAKAPNGQPLQQLIDSIKSGLE